MWVNMKFLVKYIPNVVYCISFFCVSLHILWCLMSVTKEHEIFTVANTRCGQLRGELVESMFGKGFVAYQGIPYAVPPLDELRFKPPVPPESWTHIRNARHEPPMCLQFLFSTEVVAGSEDCLYLNVYKPIKAKCFPVLVAIHGGAFHAGEGGLEYFDPELFLEHDVVLVTLNYRLGVLGFLSTGDRNLPGNYGLKDQVMALRWVQENIDQFGGDPRRVILYGTGSGAACVHYHLLSPLSTGLFSSAIYQDSSALNNWAFQPDPKSVAFKVAEEVHCTTEPISEMIECLTHVPPEKLVGTLRHFPRGSVGVPIPFTPVKEIQRNISCDPPFLSDHPECLLQRGLVNDVPVITGHSEVDYTTFGLLKEDEEQNVPEFNNNFVDVVRKLSSPNSLPESSISKIRQFYFGQAQITNANTGKLIKLLSEVIFVHSVRRAALLQASAGKSPVYYFVFNTTPYEHHTRNKTKKSISMKKIFSRIKESKTPFLKFGSSESEGNLWNAMKSLFSDFASTGNPTPENSQLRPNFWKPLRKNGSNLPFHYLGISDKFCMTPSNKCFSRSMDFWNSLYQGNQSVNCGKRGVK